MAMDKNKYANSSGSLIGVRKRTMDKAPTKPRDKANDDLTTVIIKVVVSSMNGNTCANVSRLFNMEPKRRK
jgi:hypothetical protein